MTKERRKKKTSDVPFQTFRFLWYLNAAKSLVLYVNYVSLRITDVLTSIFRRRFYENNATAAVRCDVFTTQCGGADDMSAEGGPGDIDVVPGCTRKKYFSLVQR